MGNLVLYDVQNNHFLFCKSPNEFPLSEEVNVPIDEQDEELTSEDGFIVDDGEELMTTDDEDEDSDPTAVEGEEEMVTDESSDDDLMGEDRQPETVQGTVGFGI